MTERQLQQAILDCARLLGWLCYHAFDSRKSERGFPDLVLVKPPRLIFAELKVGRGKLTPEQERWIGALCGCPPRTVGVHVWRPVDWTSGRIESTLRDG